MTWTLVDSGGAALNAASGGTAYTFPLGAAAAGDILLVGLSSDTIISGVPSGWSIADSDVGSIGAYALWKLAAGGETSVTITTSGDHPTALAFLRYSGGSAAPLDVVAHARSVVSNTTTPAVTTPALAGSNELGVAFACLGGLQNFNQTGISWSAGFTNRVDQNTGAFTLTDQHIFAADNRAAGPAALSPNATWTGATNNQTIIVVTFKPSGASEVDLAATLTGTGSLAATLTNEVHLTDALASAGSLSAGLANEVHLAATLTATAGLSAALSTPTGPADPIGTPVAQELLTCFTTQLQQLPSPPARIQLRVGQETGPLIGPNVDECCAGLAWIRIANIYPSWDSFPAPDNTWLPCGPLAYAVVLEMGVAFCMPWSDSDDSFENVDPPGTQDWSTAFTTQMQHQTLMRRAAACCWRPTQRRAVGEWSPLPVEGGCTGGKLLVTVSVPAPCADC